MRDRFFRYAFAFVALFSAFSAVVSAQSGSTRPRRVDPSTNQTPPPASTTTQPRPTATTAAAASASGDTARAFALLQQKQYAEAAKEAHAAAATDPKNSEAWKIAGFAEFYQNQFKEAAADLQRALDLQRAAKEEDAPTVDALAQSLARSEDFEHALPLLVIATSRAGVAPDATLLYYRGLAEYRLDKKADAERSFNAAVKVKPTDAASLFYLGRLAYERNQTDAAIAALNRATLADPRLADGWMLLTYSYLRRAAAATVPAKADADYLNAVRSSDALVRVRAGDEPAAALNGQALIGAKQFPRAITVLERAGANPDARGSTLYLLGVAYSRAKNFPKAIATFERAAAKTADDVNIYRELGYAYEVSKQYAKALAAYQKGAELAPDDDDFKESIERVRPFAK
ncbi:MAG TPA: tetratricopeptide repeat protein [Pyrinomonadaceae bacterium]|jgi:tetratricopeptide (TPR) repeat protein|nr:tetratricopeptide repeat protein [Pyrinomonadaceae bacterium]